MFLIQTFQLPYYNSLRLLTDYFACTLWVLVNCSDGSGHILDKLTTLGVAYQKGLLTKRKSYKLILYEVELFSWKTPSHKDHLEVCLPDEDFYLVRYVSCLPRKLLYWKMRTIMSINILWTFKQSNYVDVLQILSYTYIKSITR